MKFLIFVFVLALLSTYQVKGFDLNDRDYIYLYNKIDSELEYDYEYVLLNFWASWCRPCKEDVPLLSKFSKENTNSIVIGVSIMDDFNNAKKFIESNDIQFPNIFDKHLRVYQEFKPINGIPVTILLDSASNILFRFDGILNETILKKIENRVNEPHE